MVVKLYMWYYWCELGGIKWLVLNCWCTPRATDTGGAAPNWCETIGVKAHGCKIMCEIIDVKCVV